VGTHLENIVVLGANSAHKLLEGRENVAHQVVGKLVELGGVV
jgi:hypothetical protein